MRDIEKTKSRKPIPPAAKTAVIAPLDRWTEKEQTQAEVETFILDQVYLSLPEPP